jgi:hypothetical protein
LLARINQDLAGRDGAISLQTNQDFGDIGMANCSMSETPLKRNGSRSVE